MNITFDVTKLVVELVVALAGILVSSLYPKVKAWFEAKLSSEQLKKLEELIAIAAGAAEQTLKADDPTGEERLRYVKSLIAKLGYEITEQVEAMIENEVRKINLSPLFDVEKCEALRIEDMGGNKTTDEEIKPVFANYGYINE